jgi:hypothetical protein
MSYDSATGNLLTAIAGVGPPPHFNATTRFTYNNRGQMLTATDPRLGHGIVLDAIFATALSTPCPPFRCAQR